LSVLHRLLEAFDFPAGGRAGVLLPDVQAAMDALSAGADAEGEGDNDDRQQYGDDHEDDENAGVAR
jgi:hypothetical protein